MPTSMKDILHIRWLWLYLLREDAVYDNNLVSMKIKLKHKLAKCYYIIIY